MSIADLKEGGHPPRAKLLMKLLAYITDGLYFPLEVYMCASRALAPVATNPTPGPSGCVRYHCTHCESTTTTAMFSSLTPSGAAKHLALHALEQ